MNKFKILDNILQMIETNNEYKTCEDGLAYWLKLEEANCSKKTKHNYMSEMIRLTTNAMQVYVQQREYKQAERFRELIFKMYRYDSQDYFESYMIALEYDRVPKERFYMPRRKIMKPFVETLQRLADGDIDELFLSCPPRVGKTTLVLFFITWLMGKYPQYPNLYCSYSATLTGKFYDGVLEILQDSATYNWDKIFPDRVLPNKNNGLSNAKDQTLNIDKLKHYPTLTCRSLYGTLNGACDVESGILIADDLLSGIEEALNPDRLDTAWGKVDNNMLTRAKQTSRVLWIGTRWSIKDPIGRRLNLLQTDEKFKYRKWEEINIPALDENDESNFNYDFGVGFSTEMFHQRRASFEHNNDIASWLAQYMGQPIEREGTVFDPNRMNFFDELPKEALSLIDWKFCPVDPAFGGGDYVACPICYVFDKKIYVVDVVYNNSDKNITQNAIANKVVRYGVTTCRVEATKSTTSYAEGVKEKLDSKEYKCNIETKPATTTVSKEIRIFEKAPDIMDNFYFLSSGKRSKEYEMFMQNVFSFKQNGNNKHDDAPDSLSMAQEMFEEQVVPKIEIFQRLF